MYHVGSLESCEPVRDRLLGFLASGVSESFLGSEKKSGDIIILSSKY